MIKVKCIDTLFSSIPNFAGVYAFKLESGGFAIFDTGTPRNYVHFKSNLIRAGITPKNLTKVIISHAHMDHCGSASLILHDFPKAKLYAHPKAVPHLLKPSQLIKATKDIMPNPYYKEYGDNFQPLDPKRVIPTSDGLEIDGIKILFTEGHALHHQSVIIGKTCLTGDAFGTRFKNIDPQAIFVSTSPATFDPVKMKNSIEKILRHNINRIGLAHYGFYEDIDYHTKCCMNWLDTMKDIAESSDDIVHDVQQCFKTLFGENLEKFWPQLLTDYAVNPIGVQGYARFIKRNRQNKAK